VPHFLAIWLCLLLGFIPQQAGAAVEAAASECCRECQCCISPSTSPLPARNVPAPSSEVKTEVAEPAQVQEADDWLDLVAAPGSTVRSTVAPSDAVPRFLRHCALLL
jgi:hypothetical protein